MPFRVEAKLQTSNPPTLCPPKKKKSTSQSAFFKFRVVLGVLLCFAAITIALFALGKASAQSRSANANQVFTKQNPYTEAWLAANHGKFDNIWTAEYETRLQQPAEAVLSDLLNVLSPNYGPDVRMKIGRAHV